jgi:hypothetical protein
VEAAANCKDSGSQEIRCFVRMDFPAPEDYRRKWLDRSSSAPERTVRGRTRCRLQEKKPPRERDACSYVLTRKRCRTFLYTIAFPTRRCDLQLLITKRHMPSAAPTPSVEPSGLTPTDKEPALYLFPPHERGNELKTTLRTEALDLATRSTLFVPASSIFASSVI